MIFAAIYARKSTPQEADAEDRSVARQLAEGRAFCEAQGWTVDEENVRVTGFENLASARDRERRRVDPADFAAERRAEDAPGRAARSLVR